MKVKNWKGAEVELNENETKVYNSIASGDEYDNYNVRHFDDIHATGLSINQIKGYVSALDSKGVIQEIELPNDIMAWATV